jgi:hypothetical protein
MRRPPALQSGRGRDQIGKTTKDTSWEDAMEHPSHPAVSPAKALGILALVIVAVGGYLGLAALLGNREAWAGFLFLATWGLVEKLDLKAAPRTCLGALLGLGLAWMLGGLAPLIGAVAGMAVFLGLVLLAVYLQIRGQLSLAVNPATMLFLTAGTIPHVQAGANFLAAAAAVLLGAAFFGGLAFAAAQVGRRRAAGAVAPPPAQA